MTTNSARLLLKSPAYRSWAKGENLAYAQTLIDECEKQDKQTNMLHKKNPRNLDDIFYSFGFSPRVSPSDNYRVPDEFPRKEKPHPLDLLSLLSVETEEKLNNPIFFNGLVGETSSQEFHVSIGVFNLIEESFKAKILENNLLIMSWKGGEFSSQIPKNLVPQFIRVTYTKGVVDVKIPVKEKEGIVLCAGLSKK